MHKKYPLANGHTLMNMITKHRQSKETLNLDESMTLSMRVFTKEKAQMSGRGGRVSDRIMKMLGLRSANVIGDGYCLPKAICIGVVWSDMNQCDDATEKRRLDSKYRNFTRPDKENGRRPQIQKEAAIDLLTQANMDPTCSEHNLEHLKQLASYMPAYHFCVWQLQPGTRVPTIVFEANVDAEGFIPLFYGDNHYEFFIPTMRKIKARFCFKCHKITTTKHWNKCEVICGRCGRERCEPGSKKFFCNKCSINFHSEECYKAHLEQSSPRSLPFCDKYQTCLECGHIHRRESYSRVRHMCFSYRFCNICMESVTGEHQCVHAKPTLADRNRCVAKQAEWTILFYDCESIVTSSGVFQGPQSLGVKHVPNVICYRLICNICMGGYCTSCPGPKYFSYVMRPGETGTVMERFAKFVKTDSRMKNAYIVAHNGGRYDHPYTLEELLTNEDYNPHFVLDGNTFISADITISKGCTIRFRDSVKYMPMKLSELPNAFELETKDKGYFPYLYNHPDNYHTVLPNLPPIEYYDPNSKSTAERKKFEEWYEQNKNQPFDLDEEILSYCMNDVNILTEAMVKYIKMCQTWFNGWNPVIQSCTLASFTQFVLKFEHIPDQVLGYIPENGWSGRNNSQFALKYLLWLEKQHPDLKLHHKLRASGEYFISSIGTHVDGYDEKTNTVFEIHGCLWHGCEKCYLDREALCPRNKNETMGSLYHQTVARDKEIQDAGFNLVIKWECEIKEEMARNKEMKHFFKCCNHTYQLLPRKAMKGGRCQNFYCVVVVDDEYSVEDCDFCSLYPYINIKGAEYPVGNPERITNDFEEIVPDQPTPYRGFIFCDMLPPKDLEKPVLPTHGNGKLLFVLCRTCGAGKGGNKMCTHTNYSERYLTGVWYSNEINKAIEMGYKLLRYHEVWNWTKWFRGGFFESFMKPLLKAKHEASGWPRSDMTEEEKREMIEQIKINDGVELDYDNVKKNPALRSLAKLFLNSTWGKFAQNPCKTETKMILEEKGEEILNFFNEPGYEPTCFKEWGSRYALISRRITSECTKTARFTNVIYGAVTTSEARLKLYGAMERVGFENVLYCDTDSLIFRQKRGENPLGDLRGEALGKMTDETPEGWSIQKFIGMAPKTYSLTMVNDQGDVREITKAKGLTINSETSSLVNATSMETLVKEHLKGNEQHVLVPRIKMKRGANCLDGITSEVEVKRLRAVLDKGLFTPEGRMIPYGTLNEDVDMTDDYPFYSSN